MEASQAKQFLQRLEEVLSTLPTATVLTPQLERWVSERDRERDTHLFRREAAFVNRCVVPILFELIQDSAYLGKDLARAKAALRNESLKGMERYTLETAAWLAKQPFSKRWPGTPEQTYSEWCEGKGLRDSWPDAMLSDDCLPRVVFECKYFVEASETAAHRALVTGLYEAAFYRGLPPLPATDKHRAWACDYACFIAYDASEGQELLKAWKAVKAVHAAFWDGAHVYPIVFTGNASTWPRALDVPPV